VDGLVHLVGSSFLVGANAHSVRTRFQMRNREQLKMASQQRIPIFDGHNDTLGKVGSTEPEEARSFFVKSERGHLDLPRAEEAGFAGGLFAVFVEGESTRALDAGTVDEQEQTLADGYPELGHAQQAAISMMAKLFRLESDSRGKLRVVRAADELDDCLREGVLAAVLHIEGAEAIDPDLDALVVFYQAGLRSLGIVWSRPNAFGHGVPFEFPSAPDTGPGLTDAGKALVRACNQLGILVDVSHLNEKGFWDVAGLSDAPLVATHSAVHALCPSSRNLTDAQLDAIGASGGVIGVNFHVGFLREDGQDNAVTPLADIVRHINYIAERIGIEHVAFGSDFDGATMPRELGDVTGLPRLIAALDRSGYDANELRLITHGNWLRVLRQTLR
jgi:membrane dipeptidase